ncbi:MAG: aminopeptidase, partial [Nanobdellota archaeon]
TDSETLEIAVSMMQEAKKITPKIRFFIAEDFGERPLKRLPSVLKDALKESDVGVIAMQGKKGELEKFRRPLLNLVNDSSLRIANMVNINQKIMVGGMNADYQKIQAFSNKIYGLVKNAQHIEVKSKKGTDLIAEFSGLIKWVIADGQIRKGEWSNLPNGEVFTSPVNVNGKLVIDGVLGDYFAQKYGLLQRFPLIVKIKNGKVVETVCKNKQLQKDFIERINTDSNANRVGEFAIGTNIFLKELIGRLLQDEKFPGVHIAFGHGYPYKTGVTWNSEVHVDAVIKKPTVLVDGEKIMKEGDFLV